ncbi:hypothetical protein N9B14_08180, partial [Akkermansiaceae bacterium]|nr:hypothetical protein [Akkermansiaceae bacterium]
LDEPRLHGPTIPTGEDPRKNRHPTQQQEGQGYYQVLHDCLCELYQNPNPFQFSTSDQATLHSISLIFPKSDLV